MPEFGKRRSVPGAEAAPRADGPRIPDLPADLETAAEALASGKLPSWAKRSAVMLVVMLLVAAGLFWWLVLTHAGGVFRDSRFAGTWQPAYDLQVVEGRCRRYQLILTACQAEVRSVAEPGKPPVAIPFMMAFSSGGGEALVPVRSTADPSAVTIAYAAETKLMNRFLTLATVACALLALLVLTTSALVRGRYKGGAAHRALLAGLEELTARAELSAAGRRRLEPERA